MRHASPPRPFRDPLRFRARGFAMIVVSIIITLVFAFAVVLLDASLSTKHLQRAYQGELTASELAEAGIHKAIFCFAATSGANCGGRYGTAYTGESNVSFGGGVFTTTVSGSGNTYTVSSTGTAASGDKLKVIADITRLPPTDGTQFSYALQAGAGGAHLENNSKITGTIYANGNIDCQSTNAEITGDAYSSVSDGSISACKIRYNAHADKILNSNVRQDAYYRNDPADISGTTVTGAKHSGSSTPAAAPMPSLDLDFWRNSASNGGIINGDYHPATGSDLGPAEITGNLLMDNNVSVTVKGPVWIRGNITTGNNDTFTLDSSFGSYGTVILADDPNDNANHGRVTITNGTAINGSGDPKSHILFISTNNSQSNTVPAISVANTAAGAAFYALNGVMRLQNRAEAKSLAGYRLFLDQNAEVEYESSDFSGQFSNSPAGAWRLKEGSWREVH